MRKSLVRCRERPNGQTFSVDEVIHEPGADPAEADPIPVEYLCSLSGSGLPPGELNLKVGSPVILLHSLRPSAGLCNRTQMIVTCISTCILEVRLIGGEHNRQVAFIPRISMVPTASTDTNFQFKCRQFPIRLAFALSINKAQGQSVKYVGLNLQTPIFAHGQLYVALSCATASCNVKILLPDDATEPVTQNVIYQDVLL